MQADLIEPDSPRWAEALETMPHDVFHLPSYLAFAAKDQVPGRPCAFLAEENGRRFLVPLIVRRLETGERIPGDHFDATGPRNYAGPIVSPEADGAFVDRAVDTFRRELCRRRIITAFIRLHPLLDISLAPLERTGWIVHHPRTVAIDLTLPWEEIWRQTRRDHRRHINRAARQGQVARIDETWEHFEHFLDIYEQTMSRVGATSDYHLSQGYFERLRRALGSRIHLCVVELEGQVAAAGLFTEVSGVVEYLLSGTRGEYLPDSPAKTMLDFVRRWAKGRGNRVLLLGGSPREDGALFHFKIGFSEFLHPVRSWRMIADEAVYEALVADWQQRYQMKADEPTDFFPAYRATPTST